MANYLALLIKDRDLENNLELLQQIALRNYLKNGEESKPFYSLITSARVANEVYQRVSGSRKIDDLRKACIANIIKYIQDHPNASKAALQKEVVNQIQVFAVRVASI